jgi:transposase
MPPSLQEWLPEGHLAWCMLDVVSEMDLSLFYERYRPDGHGRPAYEPSMMGRIQLVVATLDVEELRCPEETVL